MEGIRIVTDVGETKAAKEDFGEPCVLVYSRFEDDGKATLLTLNGSSWLLTDEASKTHQVKLLATRADGDISDIWIQRVEADSGSAITTLHLKGADAKRLVGLLGNGSFMSVVRADSNLSSSAATAAQVFNVPVTESVALVYQQHSDEIRALVSNDATVEDIIAFAHRREQVQIFRRMLEDEAYFESLKPEANSGSEVVWQKFFEANPWILGVSLAGQLITSWSDERLEQVVAGSSISGPGKRTDALLRTSGRIKSSVFVEFKHHLTPLLGKEYRTGCWQPSEELTGAVAQIQGTVQYAIAEIGRRLPDHDEDGYDIPGEFTYMLRPRTYVIAGSLQQLKSSGGGDQVEKVQSLELYRRNLSQPEIITFDELLARAEWLAGDA